MSTLKEIQDNFAVATTFVKDGLDPQIDALEKQKQGVCQVAQTQYHKKLMVLFRRALKQGGYLPLDGQKLSEAIQTYGVWQNKDQVAGDFSGGIERFHTQFSAAKWAFNSPKSTTRGSAENRRQMDEAQAGSLAYLETEKAIMGLGNKNVGVLQEPGVLNQAMLWLEKFQCGK